MKRSMLGLLVSSALCGCTIFDEEYSDDAKDINLQSQYLQSPTISSETSAPLESSIMFQRQFQQELSSNNSAKYANEIGRAYAKSELSEYANPISASKHNIHHYAKGLMQELVANLQYVNSATPVAVVSFVMLDSDYNKSSLLGNQIAESLTHEIHKFGIPIIDYKTTGFVRVTEQGDFAFSKDYEELGESLAARYIVGGTMTKHIDGYLVNARVVGLKSKAVVATAQSFIPNAISDALIMAEPTENSINAAHLKHTSSNHTLKTQDNAQQTISIVGN